VKFQENLARDFCECTSKIHFVFFRGHGRRSCSHEFSVIVQFDRSTAVGAPDFVHCARLSPVNLFLGFRSREQSVQTSQWFEGVFDLLLP